MSHFSKLPEFDKEFKRLQKKYPSLSEDLELFEEVIFENPIGMGINFAVIHHDEVCKIVKARLACRSLRGRSIRVIYAVHQEGVSFVYIELYFKGDKENHDYQRVEEYLKNL